MTHFNLAQHLYTVTLRNLLTDATYTRTIEADDESEARDVARLEYANVCGVPYDDVVVVDCAVVN